MSPKIQLALNSVKAGIRGFPLFKPLANYARAERAKTLQKYGLLFEDIIIEEEPVVKALARADPKELVDRYRLTYVVSAALISDRERRLFRAFDLNMKKKELPDEMRNYDPYRSYLGDLIKAAEEEKFEREVINHY